MKLFNVLILVLAAHGAVMAMQREPAIPQDANGYQYRDENTVEDKRRIAILPYGSLVNQAASTGAGVRIAATTSQFQWLPNARQNLAGHEGAPYRGQQTGYDLSNIFYMKKLMPARQKDRNEEIIPNTDRWVIRIEAEPQKLPIDVAQRIARWADSQGYSAVIWAPFGEQRVLPVQVQTMQQQPQAPQSARDQQLHHENYVYYQRGDLPILLTAPHGGEVHIQGVPNQNRNRSSHWSNNTNVLDVAR